MIVSPHVSRSIARAAPPHGALSVEDRERSAGSRRVHVLAHRKGFFRPDRVRWVRRRRQARIEVHL